MTAVLWMLGVLAYLAIGVGLARLQARRLTRRVYVRADVQAEMLAWMFLWPICAPCWLLFTTIRWVLFPRSLR